MLSPHEEDVVTGTHTDEMQWFYPPQIFAPFSQNKLHVLTHLIWVTTQRPGWMVSNPGHVYRRQSLNQKQSMIFFSPSCPPTTIKQEIQSFTDDWE